MKGTLVALMLALPAFAAAPVWVVGKDVKLLKDAKASAATVATLKTGDELVFVARNAKDKKFAEVTLAGRRGFVSFDALSALEPQKETPAGRGLEPPAAKWLECAQSVNQKARAR